MAISASSAETYKVIIGNLRAGLGGDGGLDFLLDFAKVKNWLETNPTKKTKKPLSSSSLKTYYSAIRNAIKDDSRFAEVGSLYANELKKLTDESRAKEDDQTLTEDEKKKWICWNCVGNVRTTLLDDYYDKPTLENYQDYLIICLYSLQEPVRLDYAPMRFVEEAPKDSEENFCELKGDRATFVLNSYKTARKYGTMYLDAPPELVDVLKKWRTINTTEWFLLKGQRPMTSQELGLEIKGIFLRLLNIGATLNILRHSYRTFLHEGEPSLAHQKETARRMGHSVLMGQRYRRIDAEVKNDEL